VPTEHRHHPPAVKCLTLIAQTYRYRIAVNLSRSINPLLCFFYLTLHTALLQYGKRVSPTTTEKAHRTAHSASYDSLSDRSRVLAAGASLSASYSYSPSAPCLGSRARRAIRRRKILPQSFALGCASPCCFFVAEPCCFRVVSPALQKGEGSPQRTLNLLVC